MNRHFILTSGRSGSNYIANMLNQHSNVVNIGEVFGEWTAPYKLYQLLKHLNYSWPEFLDILYRNPVAFYAAQSVTAFSHVKKKKPINFKRRSDTKTIGMKDFFVQINRRGVEDYLLVNTDIKIIHLKRRNLLKRYVSGINMNTNGVVLKDSSGLKTAKASIDIEHMKQYLDVLKSEEVYENNYIKKLDSDRVLSIFYEDHFTSNGGKEEMTKSILEHLGVPGVGITSLHMKISSDDLGQAIANYEQVAKALSGTEYEKYLNA